MTRSESLCSVVCGSVADVARLRVREGVVDGPCRRARRDGPARAFESHDVVKMARFDDRDADALAIETRLRVVCNSGLAAAAPARGRMVVVRASLDMVVLVMVQLSKVEASDVCDEAPRLCLRCARI